MLTDSSERSKHDDKLNYIAGPADIMVSGWDETITVYIYTGSYSEYNSLDHNYLVEDFINAIRYAWNVNDKGITKTPLSPTDTDSTTLVIKYNLEILQWFFEHTILFEEDSTKYEKYNTHLKTKM